MRAPLAVGLLLFVLTGCAPGPYDPMAPYEVAPPQPAVAACNNPLHVPAANREFVWETVVDVVDDYFKIEHEEPVRLIGNTLTEGRLETFPQGSPTLLEPWRRDKAGRYEKIENTLQSMRRRAILRVVPAENGYWINVVVFKELEDVARPEHATAAAATFRYDDTLRRIANPVGEQQIDQGWIPQGRDVMLEQKIIAHLQNRLQVAMQPPVMQLR